VQIDLFTVLLLVLLGRLLGTLFKRIDAESMIGEVLAGMLVGGLIIIGWVFYDSSTLKAFSDLGIILLMLLSGLMTDFRAFSKNKNASILVGSLGVAVSFAFVFFPMYFLNNWLLGLSPQVSLLSSLFIAAILSNTAIEVCAKLFMGRPGGGRLQAVVMGASFVDDIIAVFLIGIVSSIVLLGRTPSPLEFGFLAFKVIAFLLLSFLVITRLVDKLFDRLMGKKESEEKLLLTATVVIAFLFALAARPFGLHEVIGAYMAGLIIGKWGSRIDPLLKRRLAWKKLIEDIDPPLRALFGPLFFGYIGLTFVFYVRGTFDPVIMLILVSLLSILAFGGKLIGCGMGAKVSGFAGKETVVIGAAMCGRGALEFVLLSYGRDIAILTDDQFSAVVVVTLLTILATPLLYAWTEKRARKAAKKNG